MAGKKNRKTATPASTKATTAPAAAAAGHNSSEKDACVECVGIIHEVLSCKGTAVLKSPLMEGLLCLLDKVVDVVEQQDTEGEFISGPLEFSLLMVSATLVQLVTKLLAARKRPRDWKQKEYSSTVASVLSAVRTILGAPTLKSCPGQDDPVKVVLLGELPSVFARASLPDLTRQAAAAQEEVCQLLQSALKPQQQGQQAGRDTVQQHPHLWQAAHELLLWWRTLERAEAAHGELAADPDKILADQQPALELAAALTQGMAADSSLEHLQEVITLTAHTARAVNLTMQDREDEPEEGLPPVTQGLQPSLLHLSITLLLAQSWRRAVLLPQEGGCGSSCSSYGSSGVVAVDSNSGSSGSGSGSSISSKGRNQLSQAERTGKLEQACRDQQQLQQLASITMQLWQQLGLAPDALPAYAAALASHPTETDDGELLTTTVTCVRNCLKEITGLSNQEEDDCTVPAASVTFDELSRQVQLLLPRVALQLPQLLLLLASHADPRSPDDVAGIALAVQAADISLATWVMPGLLPAALSTIAAGCGAGALVPVPLIPHQSAVTAAQAGNLGTSFTLPGTKLLSGLLGAWLGMMHNLLLQPKDGLLHAAASAKLQVLPDRRIICPVIVGAFVPPDDMRGQTWSCFETSCSRVQAVSWLFEVLRDLAATPAPGTPSDTLMSSPVWYSTAPAVLLLLETLTRGVMPHHALCTVHSIDSGCVVGSSLSSERGGCSSNHDGSSSSGLVCDAGQNLRNMLDMSIGDRSNSMIVKLCLMILQNGISAAAQQQQQPQPQQQSQQQPQQQLQQQPHQQLQRQPQQPQPQEKPLLQQRLLHLWSLTVSLLKLPIRNQSGMQLIQGCIMTTSFALEAVQMMMRKAPPSSSCSLLEQRLVLAPWLALTGRCLLAQARLLSTLKALPLPPDLAPLLTCFKALFDCLERLQNGLCCWRSGFSSSNGSDVKMEYCLTIMPDITPTVLLSSLGQLQDQLQADTAFATGGGCTAVAAASAAAASAAGYLPAYSDLQGVCSMDLQEHLTGVLQVLTHMKKHATHFQGSSLDSSSSCSSGGFYSSDGSSAAVAVGADVHKCYHHSSVTIQLLEQLGLSLCNQLPMPWLCNNPCCSNLSGVSELQLIGGKACVCGGCRLGRYCSRDCQSSHWLAHKPVCQQLAAAAAGGSGNALQGGQAAA